MVSLRKFFKFPLKILSDAKLKFTFTSEVDYEGAVLALEGADVAEVFFNGKWMELGGAGICRKEVVEPFGIDMPVLAWGFGFERLAMLKWGITDIRELYISDMDLLKKNRVI